MSHVPFAAPAAHARLVVTLPQRPSKLEHALATITPDGFPALTATHEAFTHLARRSKKRLVVITPFIDEPGVEWASQLFRGTTAPERILVVRSLEAMEAKAPGAASRLRDLTTEVLEYQIRHPAGLRALPIETFHAKIVMADGAAAYVGSANLLHSPYEFTLECGFIIEGPAVAQVVDLVEAILTVSRGARQNV